LWKNLSANRSATDFKEKKFKRGGSTISMQLIKNAFLSRNKTLSRKIEEILIVWLIENNRIMSKNRMLEVYLTLLNGAAAFMVLAKHQGITLANRHQNLPLARVFTWPVLCLIDEIVKVRQISHESLEGYKGMMLGAVNGRTDEQKLAWAHKQAYIALGVLVSAAADLAIDICPMEGFSAPQFDEILGLTEKGLTASVIATIGYRSADDVTATFAKVRKPTEELFIHV
jgi:hypothetical protein